MAKKNLTVIARIQAKPGKEAKVKQELMKLVAPTHAEAGCIQYDLHQAIEDSALFFFYETLVSKKTLDEHLAKPHLAAFMEKAGGWLAAEPDIWLCEMISQPKPRGK